MTIGYMKKTEIKRLMNNHGLIHIRGDYYLLKIDKAAYEPEEYNILLVSPLKDPLSEYKNYVEPIELRELLLEVSPSLRNADSFAAAASILNLPTSIVRKAERIDEGMDNFTIKLTQ